MEREQRRNGDAPGAGSRPVDSGLSRSRCGHGVRSDGGFGDTDFFEEEDLVLGDHLATMDERWLTPLFLRRVETGLVGCCAPETLRIQAMRTLRKASPDNTARGELLLKRSLALARMQGAASWELRTATSFARHWQSCGRSAEARSLLEPVHARFVEGFRATDWRAASAL